MIKPQICCESVKTNKQKQQKPKDSIFTSTTYLLRFGYGLWDAVLVSWGCHRKTLRTGVQLRIQWRQLGIYGQQAEGGVVDGTLLRGDTGAGNSCRRQACDGTSGREEEFGQIWGWSDVRVGALLLNWLSRILVEGGLCESSKGGAKVKQTW